MRLGVLSPQKIQDIQDIFTGLQDFTGLTGFYRILQDLQDVTSLVGALFIVGHKKKQMFLKKN